MLDRVEGWVILLFSERKACLSCQNIKTNHFKKWCPIELYTVLHLLLVKIFRKSTKNILIYWTVKIKREKNLTTHLRPVFQQNSYPYIQLKLNWLNKKWLIFLESILSKFEIGLVTRWRGRWRLHLYVALMISYCQKPDFSFPIWMIQTNGQTVSSITYCTTKQIISC